MIIRAVFLTRWNSDSIEPIILDAAYNLLEYNYFTRNSVKEFLTAAAATLMKRLTPGVHCVDFEGAFPEMGSLGVHCRPSNTVTVCPTTVAEQSALHPTEWPRREHVLLFDWD